MRSLEPTCSEGIDRAGAQNGYRDPFSPAHMIPSLASVWLPHPSPPLTLSCMTVALHVF